MDFINHLYSILVDPITAWILALHWPYIITTVMVCYYLITIKQIHAGLIDKDLAVFTIGTIIAWIFIASNSFTKEFALQLFQSLVMAMILNKLLLRRIINFLKRI